MSVMASQSPAHPLFVEQLFKLTKENIRAVHCLSFVWGTTSHQWIPLTEGQQYGKLYHVMTWYSFPYCWPFVRGIHGWLCHVMAWSWNAGVIIKIRLGFVGAQNPANEAMFAFLDFTKAAGYTGLSLGLTHCGLVTTYGDKDPGQHWFRLKFVAWWNQAIARTNIDLLPMWLCGTHLFPQFQRKCSRYQS